MRLNRRDVLRDLGSTIGLAAVEPGETGLFAQSSDLELREMRPANAFGPGCAFAVSADGKRILFSAGSPVQRFRVWPSGEVNAYDQSRRVLRCFAVDHWTQIWASTLPAAPYRGSFFADGNRSLVQAGESWHVIDALGNVVESHRLSRAGGPDAPSERLGEIDAYRGSLAIGQMARKPTGVDWIQLDTSDGRALRRASGPSKTATGRSVRAPTTPLSFSTDREVFVCGVQNQIELRRASDLSLVCSLEGRSDLSVGRTGVSHSGSLAAAAFGTGRQEPNGMYRLAGVETVVYDVRRGKAIRHFPLDAYEGLAISPDDRYLATACVVYSARFREYLETRILVTEIATGKLAGAGRHIRVRDERGGRLIAGLATQGLYFLPGSQLLISTGSITKVWIVP